MSNLTSLKSLFSLAVVVGILGGVPQTARAATTLYWSGNGSTLGGTGTWDTTLLRWGVSPAGPFTGNWTNAGGDTAIFGGQYVGLPTVTLNSAITAGGLTFNYGGYTITGNGNILSLTGPNAPIQVDQGMATINASLSDAGGGLVKNGAGMLYLNADNSAVTGNLTLNAGYLRVDTSANALGLSTSGNLVLNGGTLDLTNSGNLSYSRNTIIGGNTAIYVDPRGITANTSVVNTMGTLAIGSQTLTVVGMTVSSNANFVAGLTFGNTTLSGNAFFNVMNRTKGANTLLTLGAVTGTGNIAVGGRGGNVTFSSTIDNTIGAITQYAFQNTGTLTFSDAVNAAGPFTLYGGTAILSGNNTSLVNATDVRLLGGTLQLGLAADTNVSRFNSSANLTLGGGILNKTAGVAGVFTQNINSLSLMPGVSAMTGNGGGNYLFSITSNTVARDVGSIMSFSNGANFPVKFATAPTLSGNLIGGWATFGGNNFATQGAGNIGGISYDATGNNAINSLTGDNNIDQVMTSNTVMTNTQTINALRLTGNATSFVLDLNQKTLTIATGGFISYTSAGGVRTVTTNGTLTAGTTANSELFLIPGNSTGNMILGATIADNGVGAVHVVRGGDVGATVYLSGVNTYTGSTVLGARSDIANYGYNVTNPSAPTTILTERQLGAYPTSFSANKVVINNGAISFADVPISWSANRGLTLGGMGGTILTNTVNSPTNFILPMDIAGTGPLYIRNNTGSMNVILSGNSTFDGEIINGNGNGNISFTTIGNINGGPSSLGNPTNPTNGIIRQSGNNGYLTFVGVGNQSSDRDFIIGESADSRLKASGAGTLTLTGNIYLDPGRSTPNAAQFGGTGFGILAGTIVGTDPTVGQSITKMNEGGTWRLTGQNTYTGTTSISNGVLEFTTIGNVGGGPSSFGAPSTTANATLGLGGGTLRFVGSTDQSSDRVFNMTASTTVESSGSANLTLRGGVTGNTFSLTLGGTGNGFVSGANVIATTTGGLTKNGPGTWTINTSAANTYSGTTTMGGGTLVLDFSNMTTPTDLIKNGNALTFGSNYSAGTLAIVAKSTGTTSQTFGAVTFGQDGGGSKIALNTNGGGGLNLIFGTTSLLPYGRTTNITGFNVGATTNITTTGSFGALVNGLYPFTTINDKDFATATSNNTTLGIYAGYIPLPNGITASTSTYTLADDQIQNATLTFTGLKLGPINSAGLGLHMGSYAISPGGGTNGSAIIFDGTGSQGYTIDGTTGFVMSGTNFAIHVAGNQPLTIAAPIKFEGNTNTFVKGGDGTLILSGNNTSGSTTPTPAFRVAAGTLQAGSSTAFSPYASMSVSVGATLALNGYSNAVYSLLGSGTVTNGGANDATLTFGYNPTNNTAPTGPTFGPATITLPIQSYGILTNGTGNGTLAINKVGSSLQILSGNNTFTGNVTVSEGTLSVPTLTNAGVAGPLGMGTTLILGGADRQGILEVFGTHNYATDRAVTLTARGVGVLAVANANVNGIAAQTLFGDGALFSGNITGSGQLAKSGLGNLFLSGTNTYGGATHVTSGVLQFNNPGAIGGSGASVLVQKTGTVAAGYAMDQNFLSRINPASSGVVALGASTTNDLNLSNLSNVSLGAAQNFSLAGNLTPAGSTYKLGGGLGTLFIQNANTLTGNNSLVVTPNNTYQASVVLSDVQNYTGSTTVGGTIYYSNPQASPIYDSSAALILAGGSVGIVSTSNVILNNFGTLRIVASAGDAIANKLGVAPITMNGGTLEYRNDGSAANFAQNLGNVTLNQGQSTIITGTTSGQTSILTLGNLTRTAGNFSNVVFQGSNTGTGQIIVPAGTVLGAWAAYGTTGFATVNISNQVIKDAENGPITTVAGFNSSNTNFYAYTGNTVAAGSGTARTIRFTGNQAASTINLNATDTLSFNALMTNDNNSAVTLGNSVATGTVQPASGSEMYFYTGIGSAGITVNANLTLPGGSIIKGGTATGTPTLTLAGNNTFDNLIVNSGVVTISNANSIPANANIVLNGGGVAFPAITISNPITINADANPCNNQSGTTLAGPITLNNNAMLIFTNQGNKNISGVISGNGGIFVGDINNNGETISGNASNTFNGPLVFIGAVNSGAAGHANPTITLAKTGGAVAISGDIYLGWAQSTTTGSTPRTERLILGAAGSGDNQIADTSVIYFSGGAGADAGSFELQGKNETLAGIQSQMTGDGMISNNLSGNSTLNLSPANGKTYTYSGSIRDSWNSGGKLFLTMNGTGTGTQILAGPNTFTGGIQVSGGSLLINNSVGSGSGTGSVTVNSGGTLGGIGIIGPVGTSNVTINGGGFLAPGVQTGTLAGPLTVDLGGTTSGVTMASGASLLFQLGAPGSSDMLQFYNYGTSAGRTFNLDTINGTTVNFNTLAGFGAGTYTLFQFYSDSGSNLWEYLKPTTGLTVGSGISPTYSAMFDYSTTGKINLVVTLVPEPGTLALLAFGSLAVLHRRKKKAA